MPVVKALDTLNKGDVGLYRLRHKAKGKLLYVGEGKVRDRVKAHLKKSEQPNHPQTSAFSKPQYIEASIYLSESLSKNQWHEIENDLIAAHVMESGQVPAAQFLG